MACDFCDTEPDLMFITNKETGDTQAIGTQCMPVFLKAMSQAWGCWPDLDEVLTPDVVEAKARELGIWPAGPGTATPPAPRKRTPAKATPKVLNGLQERVDAHKASLPPTDWDRVPETLLTPEERSQRAATATGTTSEAAGG